MLTDAEIAEIAQGLLDRSLPPSRWTHQAHFAAALWLLRQGGDFDMAAIIRDYNAATGTPNTDSSGYHHSITLASLAAARAALKASPAAPLSDVLAGLMAGPCGRSDWLLTHWRRNTLFSVSARRDWVPPDLLPLAC
jgi:hypothetical protein